MKNHFFKKKLLLTGATLFSSVCGDLPFGIIGGANNSSPFPPYAALISSTGIPTPINTGLSSGEILSVSLNAFGQGLIGGIDLLTISGYAAFISSSGSVTPINSQLMGFINSVAINDSAQGILGGLDFTPPFPPYTALVSPAGIVTRINTIVSGQLNSVAINNAGQSIIGGTDFTGPAYAAVISPSGILTPINTNLSIGHINTVAINNSGQGIIGGQDLTSLFPYIAFVSSNGVPTPININNGSLVGFINSVAINNSGEGLIGGVVGGAGYAAFVSSQGLPMPLNLGSSIGQIFSVAINKLGQGIVGGQESVLPSPTYAALISPSGNVTRINVFLPGGSILSVAINDFGQGVIGGNFMSGLNVPAYAAIVSPSGIATPINVGLTNGVINAVAILPLLTHVPTGSLTGNNLIFANYINQFVPQKAFYFVPSILDGTLSQALASAAPTRNAFSLYTASHNLFYWSTSLSNHLHNRLLQNRKKSQTTIATAASEAWKRPENQQASLRQQLPHKYLPYCEDIVEEKKHSLWLEGIGAWAHQKPQHQTPGFDPASGGAILGYDGKTSEHTRLGIGAFYLFTHIHEKKRAGHSNIQQEDLFIYGNWENTHFYLDAALLGGLFQTDQVRNIRMTGFHFKSKSHPHGWQLLPHAEIGYHFTRHRRIDITFNPFVMVDWANAWQHHFKERGNGPFNAGQKSHYSSLLRTEATLRVYETIFFDRWDLTFQEKIGYVNVHSFKTGRVTAFLAGSPGSFTVSTLTSDQNLGVGEFAMILTPKKSCYPASTLFYQGEFGSKYQSHQVGLELAWNF